VAYAKALHALVRWIDICDGNMQEGSFRCDANVSVRPAGSDKLGTRCEIKNLNSFRFLEKAIEFEVRRQIEVIEDGGRIVQETRLYDPDKDETRAMRSKEDAHDYRYFPDPDLLPLEISEAMLAEMHAALPELPQAKCARFAASYGITPYDAAQLTSSRELADYFEAAARGADAKTAKLCANWITGNLSARLNDENLDITLSKISGAQLRRLVDHIADGAVSGKTAKDVFDAIWAGEASGDDAAETIIKNKGLQQISDSGAIEKIVEAVLAANAQQVADYKAGKEKAFNSLVGQAMKATRGKANPQQVNEILRRKLQ
jgi:aspartyl-tRNA(Asn)/glutamyl-tRNA(Gln) amidotransferase subunit B